MHWPQQRSCVTISMGLIILPDRGTRTKALGDLGNPDTTMRAYNHTVQEPFNCDWQSDKPEQSMNSHDGNHTHTLDGRATAMGRVADRARRFPRFDPSSAGSRDWLAGLSEQDRTLAVAIDQAAARHWLTLAHLLTRHLRQPWEQLEPAVQAALIGGAAQLFYLDSVPDHAAISETVQWAKTTIRPGAGKLTNAILRRVAESRIGQVDAFDAAAVNHLPLADGRALVLGGEPWSHDPVERIAQQTGHRTWMLQSWATEYGKPAATGLAMHNLIHAPIIITGPSDEPPPIQIAAAHNIAGFHIAAQGTMFAGVALGGAHPWRVQDPGTAEALSLSASLNPSIIIDFCAGRGTKTHQLLHMHRDARIISTDVNDLRRKDLHAAFADVPRVTVIDPEQVPEHIGMADLLVLDVPCSNSGVLARRIEARYRITESAMEELVSVQRQVIADSLTLLAPGGHLLYATCSIDPRENQLQVEWINHWHRMPIEAQRVTLPGGRPGDEASRYTDGGYAGLLAARN